MTADELLRARWQQPFQPFRIVLADGSTREVTDPFHMTIGFGVCMIGNAPGDVIDMANIVRVEPLTWPDAVPLLGTGWPSSVPRPEPR
jgi:hypothetical protein